MDQDPTHQPWPGVSLPAPAAAKAESALEEATLQPGAAPPMVFEGQAAYVLQPHQLQQQHQPPPPRLVDLLSAGHSQSQSEAGGAQQQQQAPKTGAQTAQAAHFGQAPSGASAVGPSGSGHLMGTIPGAAQPGQAPPHLRLLPAPGQQYGQSPQAIPMLYSPHTGGVPPVFTITSGSHESLQRPGSGNTSTTTAMFPSGGSAGQPQQHAFQYVYAAAPPHAGQVVPGMMAMPPGAAMSMPIPMGMAPTVRAPSQFVGMAPTQGAAGQPPMYIAGARPPAPVSGGAGSQTIDSLSFSTAAGQASQQQAQQQPQQYSLSMTMDTLALLGHVADSAERSSAQQQQQHQAQAQAQQQASVVSGMSALHPTKAASSSLQARTVTSLLSASATPSSLHAGDPLGSPMTVASDTSQQHQYQPQQQQPPAHLRMAGGVSALQEPLSGTATPEARAMDPGAATPLQAAVAAAGGGGGGATLQAPHSAGIPMAFLAPASMGSFATAPGHMGYAAAPADPANWMSAFPGYAHTGPPGGGGGPLSAAATAPPGATPYFLTPVVLTTTTAAAPGSHEYLPVGAQQQQQPGGPGRAHPQQQLPYAFMSGPTTSALSAQDTSVTATGPSTTGTGAEGQQQQAPPPPQHVAMMPVAAPAVMVGHPQHMAQLYQLQQFQQFTQQQQQQQQEQGSASSAQDAKSGGGSAAAGAGLGSSGLPAGVSALGTPPTRRPSLAPAPLTHPMIYVPAAPTLHRQYSVSAPPTPQHRLSQSYQLSHGSMELSMEQLLPSPASVMVSPAQVPGHAPPPRSGHQPQLMPQGSAQQQLLPQQSPYTLVGAAPGQTVVVNPMGIAVMPPPPGVQQQQQHSGGSSLEASAAALDEATLTGGVNLPGPNAGAHQQHRQGSPPTRMATRGRLQYRPRESGGASSPSPVMHATLLTAQPPMLRTGTMPKSITKERRCAMCGAKDTPQWRLNPNGGGHLCNRCGLKLREGERDHEARNARRREKYRQRKERERQRHEAERQRQRQAEAEAEAAGAKRRKTS